MKKWLNKAITLPTPNIATETIKKIQNIVKYKIYSEYYNDMVNTKNAKHLRALNGRALIFFLTRKCKWNLSVLFCKGKMIKN